MVPTISAAPTDGLPLPVACLRPMTGWHCVVFQFFAFHTGETRLQSSIICCDRIIRMR